MRSRQPSSNAHQIALRTVIGEPGISGVFVVLLATGLGLLLDFQVTHLHPIFSVGLVMVSIPVSLFWTIRRTQLPMDRKVNPDYVRNLALATVAGQSGCMTVFLIFLGLFGGMYLDARFNTHPLFTIGLVLAAIPISLYAMVRLMLSSIAAIKPSPPAGGSRAVSSEPQSFHKENRS
jgi:F0F1-type ATP synthase assembly protein I